MYTRYLQTIEKLKETGNCRFLRNTHSIGRTIEFDHKNFLNCSSNDYLGISGQNTLWNSFLSDHAAEISQFSAGSCSSRLLTGNSKYYPELESFLAETYKRESALVFNSGYHANIGILPALSTKNDLILADKLVHASIIDGLKLCDAKIIRFRHNDLQQVEEILIKSRHEYESVFIATESVYSMDGDFCDLLKLTELKSRFNIMLYVDEAHAVGVFGKTGCGLAEEMGVMSKIDFIIGTFGKALASQGAFIVCDRLIFDFLINKMRSLIFTTALAPINLLWTKYIFEKIICMSKERDDLMKTSNYFRQQLQNHGFSTCGNSHIIPVILGENAESVRVSDHLQKQGIFVLPVRPPTVPDGTARLRFSINAQITKNDIDQVITALLSARK